MSDSPNFDVLRRVLRLVTPERMAEIVRERIGPDSAGEQLSLADAGLEDEVRALLEQRLTE